jgi:hypothetical protein
MTGFATYLSTAKGIVGQTAAGWSKPRSAGASSALLDASKEQVTSVFERLGTTPDGLTESEVQARLEVFGRNTNGVRTHDRVVAHAPEQPQKPVHSRLVCVGVSLVGDRRSPRDCGRGRDGSRQCGDAVLSGVPLVTRR